MAEDSLYENINLLYNDTYTYIGTSQQIENWFVLLHYLFLEN